MSRVSSKLGVRALHVSLWSAYKLSDSVFPSLNEDNPTSFTCLPGCPGKSHEVMDANL